MAPPISFLTKIKKSLLIVYPDWLQLPYLSQSHSIFDTSLDVNEVTIGLGVKTSR